MHLIKSSLKAYSICLGITALSIWFYFGDGSSADDLSYSKQEMDQDLCRIYTDLGLSAEKHKDFSSAVNEYKKALQHAPEALEARKHLSVCLQKLKASTAEVISCVS